MMTYKSKIALMATAAFGFAMPALAQDGLCGGVGTNGQWIGGTEATSDVSTATAAMEQMALVLQSNEYVALFTVSAATDDGCPRCHWQYHPVRR
jgi:TctA family transporter